jgi:hypothetical protein
MILKSVANPDPDPAFMLNPDSKPKISFLKQKVKKIVEKCNIFLLEGLLSAIPAFQRELPTLKNIKKF